MIGADDEWFFEEVAMARRWVLAEAVSFCGELLQVIQPTGYHLGLTGSVLISGSSAHDLDLLIYPLDTNKHAYDSMHAMKEAITQWGMKLRHDRSFVQN